MWRDSEEFLLPPAIPALQYRQGYLSDHPTESSLERPLHLVGIGGDFRKVEPERQILVARRRGMLPDVQLVEPRPVVHAVVRLQHGHKQGLAEAAGAQQEEKVRLVLQQFDVAGLVHVVVVLRDEAGEVRKSVG